MEIDFREIPEAARRERALAAAIDLEKREILTLLLDEDPSDIVESLQNVHGDGIDTQKIRWGLKDLPWLLHVKLSLKTSAYQPAED